MRKKKVLVVEEKSDFSGLMCDYLSNSGFQIHHVHARSEIWTSFAELKPDLVLLDSVRSDCDGISVCREIRAHSTVPIIFIAAQAEDIDRLLGMELGADDYIPRPFNPREIVARAKAVLRRSSPKPRLPCENKRIILDFDRYFATIEGKPVDLTPVEFRLLNALCGNPGRVFSRSQLLDAAYNDYRVVSDRTADSHIKNLRRKLSKLTPETDWIESVYGVGYRFNPSTPNPQI